MSTEASSEGTRASLLERLASSSDDPAWAEFDRIYRGFIRHICRRMGLAEEDAKDVRQEVMADLVAKMPEFKYDPGLGTFRGWLRQRVQWKVWDRTRRLERRLPSGETLPLPSEPSEAHGDTGRAGAIGGLEDFERLWDQEWLAHRLQLAKEAVKQRVNVRSYQVYDLVAFKERPVKEVAEQFRMTANHVYKIRHDVEAMMTEEVRRLKDEVP